jgi:hypothetical protein
MITAIRYDHAFVTQVPDELQEGVLYVSLEYRTAMHLCACGCRSQVVTPLRPDRWRMNFDGESVSLWPSIGNWSFPCRSHYWMERGWVRWAPTWSRAQVEAARAGRAAQASRTLRGTVVRLRRWLSGFVLGRPR